MTTLDEIQALCEAPAPAIQPLPQDKIVLYGAGNKGREILAILRSRGHSVEAFIDKRSVEPIDGVPVLLPDDSRVKSLGRDGYTAVISVFNFAVDPLEISSLLQSLGFGRVIGIAELRQHVGLGQTYWLGESASMTPSTAIATQVWELFADSESKATWAEAIALRRMLDPRHLRDLSAFDQYAPATVPTPRAQLRFVDGGAYDGDTLLGLTQEGCSFDAVVAFEPDLKNYQRLTTNVVGGHYGSEVALFPCGLGEHAAQVRFRSEGLSSSAISSDGDAIIQVVSLDECAPRFRPTYVKLDIEGAELSALKGMAKTIERSRPALAVCVYHKPADVWEIPLLIRNLLPDCRFFLRAHAWNGFELVFYAVPREMSAG